MSRKSRKDLVELTTQLGGKKAVEIMHMADRRPPTVAAAAKYTHSNRIECGMKIVQQQREREPTCSPRTKSAEKVKEKAKMVKNCQPTAFNISGLTSVCG